MMISDWNTSATTNQQKKKKKKEDENLYILNYRECMMITLTKKNEKYEKASSMF